MEFFHIPAFSAIVLVRSEARAPGAPTNDDAANARHRKIPVLLRHRANHSLPDDPLPSYTPQADCTPYRTPPTENMPPAYTPSVDTPPSHPYSHSESARSTSPFKSPAPEDTPPLSPSSEQPPLFPTPPSTSPPTRPPDLSGNTDKWYTRGPPKRTKGGGKHVSM